MKLYRDFFKNILDFIGAWILLIIFLPIIIISWCVASIETRSNGLFLQVRVGKDGKYFRVIKIKTMYNTTSSARSSITANISSNEVTKFGLFFRKYKIDEMPQLINIILGDMSFVGPRPDVPGYADMLTGNDKCILNLRPGITGPASIKYAHEQDILESVSDKKDYNDNIIWPDKVRINREYYYECSLMKDVVYMYKTLFK